MDLESIGPKIVLTLQPINRQKQLSGTKFDGGMHMPWTRASNIAELLDLHRRLFGLQAFLGPARRCLVPFNRDICLELLVTKGAALAMICYFQVTAMQELYELFI